MLHSNTVDMAFYLVARDNGGKFTVKTGAKQIVQQLGYRDRIDLSLMIGDPRFAEGIVWNLGTLKLDTATFKELDIEQPNLPRRLYEPILKPEIHHLFVSHPIHSTKKAFAETT